MAYGCGYQHPGNPALNIPPLYEHVGWKDFCEDVGKSYDTTEGVATELAQLRTAWLTPTKLGMKSDLVEGWDASGAAPNVSLSASIGEEQPIMTNVNPETILAKSGSIEGGGGYLIDARPLDLHANDARAQRVAVGRVARLGERDLERGQREEEARRRA